MKSKRNSAVMPSTRPTKAIGYCRVSSKAQIKKGHGLASQEARIREHAAWKGYVIEEIFTDNVTGGTSERRGMDALIAHLRKHRNEGRIVIIDDLSRFARGVFSHIELRRLLSEANGRLESPMMEFKDDPDSVMVELMLATVHQHQREKNAEQTKNRMRGRLMNGYWPFIGCIGWRFEHKPGEGKVLVPDEPLASIIREGLEGFASGRFQLQAEVKRFFESQPAFPKNRKGQVRNQYVHEILTKPIYAGYVEGPPGWDVPLRKGRHDGLISFETFERIQHRLREGAKAPARADVSTDFPLRGAVVCAECNHALTACWSTSKTGARHPYYMCFKKGCGRYRKSIRRDVIEGQFAELLEALTPAPALFQMIRAMFLKAWNQEAAKAAERALASEREIAGVNREIDRLVDRIGQTESDAVAQALEKRVADLERARLVLEEKRAGGGEKRGTFEELFELAMTFFASPSKLWHSGKLEWQKLVLQMTFSQNLAYAADGTFRTPITTMPFSMLDGIRSGLSGMAERESAISMSHTGS
jgi:site-specific DNA recombinase